MRRISIALLVSSAICVPVLAQESRTDTFVHLTGKSWQTLDPANAFDSVSFFVVGNVYEPLISFKSATQLDSFEPFLASKVPTLENGLISKDRRTYSFPIRPGVRFHDGSLLTPEDVRYSMLRFMLMDSEGGPAALLLRPILGVYGTRNAKGEIAVDFKEASEAVKVHKDMVVVHLKRPDSTFLKVIASLPIVTSKKWAQSHGDWDGKAASWKKINNVLPRKSFLSDHMNGTGPFLLKETIHERRGIILVRHEQYWRKPAALKKVVLKVERDGSLRLCMLESGDADAAYLENSYRADAQQLKGLKLVDDTLVDQMGDIFFFTFKTEPNERLGSGVLDGRGIPPDFFGDINVRQGFAYAFDYEKYFKWGLGDRGRRTCGPFPCGLFERVELAYQYDPQKAEAALKKAFAGELWSKGFVIPIAYSSNNITRHIAAEILKNSLEALNPKFKVVLSPLPGKEFYQELEGRKLPLYIAGHYADYPDAHSFAFGLLHSQGYYPKYQGYSNPEVDALVEEAAAIDEGKERQEIFMKLSGHAAKDLPQIYTYSPFGFRVCQDYVLGCDSRDNVSNLNFNGFPYFYSFSKKGL